MLASVAAVKMRRLRLCVHTHVQGEVKIYLVFFLVLILLPLLIGWLYGDKD